MNLSKDKCHKHQQLCGKIIEYREVDEKMLCMNIDLKFDNCIEYLRGIIIFPQVRRLVKSFFE